ncbi:hypothetical protein Slin15195_G091910 [Septoria linicola]|uniref:Uncharacterized protein n=1 Tax=Septoria linicola TaxID=215465 RepID=A0A9Q9B1T5_9PEZI|nr:hypothetical protein Slin15195_G091910 [Septoria linicola]
MSVWRDGRRISPESGRTIDRGAGNRRWRKESIVQAGVGVAQRW